MRIYGVPEEQHCLPCLAVIALFSSNLYRQKIYLVFPLFWFLASLFSKKHGFSLHLQVRIPSIIV